MSATSSARRASPLPTADRTRRARLQLDTSRHVLVVRLDAGEPITVLAGVHPGCFELFAHEPIRTISDLKGKKGRHPDARARRAPATWPIMAAYVGLDPAAGHQLGHESDGKPMELFAEGKIDAFLGFPPEPQELRARNIGRVILNSAIGSALVAVLLLHAGRQHGTSSASIRSRPSACCAPSSRPPTSAPPSRSGSRSVWSMAGSRRATTMRSRR